MRLNPTFETKINKAVFSKQDILIFPNRYKVPDNFCEVVKFLFGNTAVATEYYIDNVKYIKITGANYVLKDVKTLNADFITTELNTRDADNDRISYI